MKKIKILILLCFLAQYSLLVRATEVIYKKPPKYNFYTTTVSAPQGMEFSTLGAAFSVVQSHYSRLSTSDVSFTVSGLHGAGANLNDVFQIYLWSLTVSSANSSDTRDDGNILVGAYCSPDEGELHNDWLLYAEGSSYWCQKKLVVDVGNDFGGMCKKDMHTPNPIIIAGAEKARVEVDYTDEAPHPLTFQRLYLSGLARDIKIYSGGFGHAWRHNFYGAIEKQDNHVLKIDLPDGSRTTAVRDTYPQESTWRVAGSLDSIAEVAGGWLYEEYTSGKVHLFGQRGGNSNVKVLLVSKSTDGRKYTYSYDVSGRVKSVSNDFVRFVSFEYDSLGRVIKFIPPDGNYVNYVWEGNRYTANYRDGTSRSYIHGADQGRLLTGIEVNGSSWGLFSYENGSQGKVVVSELAGGVGRYEVRSSVGDSTISSSVRDPLGKVDYYTYALSNGYLNLIGSTTPLNNTDAVFQQRLGPLGMPVETENFNYVRKRTDWNDRRLPVAVREAVDTPEERATKFEWHSKFRLPTAVVEANRTTRYTYSDLGYPLSVTISGMGSESTSYRTNWTYHPSGLVATQSLPNGASYQFSYDALGNLTVFTSPLGRLERYTYDASGRVLTQNSPTGLSYNYMTVAVDC